MIIKILGTWCPKCKLLYTTVEDAAKKLNLDCKIIKIDNIEEIAQYNIMSMPALIVDNLLVTAWWVIQPDEMLDILKDISSHKNHECCGGGECGDDDGCCGWCNNH